MFWWIVDDIKQILLDDNKFDQNWNVDIIKIGMIFIKKKKNQTKLWWWYKIMMLQNYDDVAKLCWLGKSLHIKLKIIIWSTKIGININSKLKINIIL